jgi:H+-transporting ATPase
VATIVDAAGKTRHYAKGAPQAITALAKPDAGLLSRYQATVAELAGKGYRALGVGQSDDGKTWSIVGLISLMETRSASRAQIFERIESYIHYRVAMTLDIMVLVVASIVLFQFKPITAIMIVALALLDDIPIMTIAYDNVPAPPQPVRWNMPGILLVASIMGLLSVVETFGLLLIGLRWVADPQLQDMIKLDHAQLQTVMFLQLAVGGHLLLFVVHTKRSLFEPPAIPPSAIIAVWIYCLIWMVVLDILKLAFLRIIAARDRGMARQRANLSG